MGGFERPSAFSASTWRCRFQSGSLILPCAAVLHGLCFMGIAAKHVLQSFGPFEDIKVRFAGVVYPGETLVTEMWKESGKVIFSASPALCSMRSLKGVLTSVHVDSVQGQGAQCAVPRRRCRHASGGPDQG